MRPGSYPERMRRVLALALAGVALAAGSAASGGSTDGITLRIAYWEDGTTLVPTSVWTLRCNPADGTLLLPGRACRKLARAGHDLFAPVPETAVCTEIYGGPQRARVTGSVNGARVWATFTRTNGCNIDRWQRLSPWLLPPGGIT